MKSPKKDRDSPSWPSLVTIGRFQYKIWVTSNVIICQKGPMGIPKQPMQDNKVFSTKCQQVSTAENNIHITH